MFSVILAAAVGYVAGAFTPAVGRKIKALFVKEGAVVKAKVGEQIGKKL
jgi:hypothetical protein